MGETDWKCSEVPSYGSSDTEIPYYSRVTTNIGVFDPLGFKVGNNISVGGDTYKIKSINGSCLECEPIGNNNYQVRIRRIPLSMDVE